MVDTTVGVIGIQMVLKLRDREEVSDPLSPPVIMRKEETKMQ